MNDENDQYGHTPEDLDNYLLGFEACLMHYRDELPDGGYKGPYANPKAAFEHGWNEARGMIFPYEQRS